MKQKEDYLQEIFKILESIDGDFKDWSSLSTDITSKIKTLKKQKSYCMCCSGLDKDKLPKTNLKFSSIEDVYSQVLDISKDITYSDISYKSLICDRCYIKYNIGERKSIYLNKKQQEQQKIEKEKYLKRQKDISWNVFSKGEKGYASPYQRLEFVSNYMVKNPEKAKEIVSLPYKLYLTHWYWWAISQYVKYRNPSCAVCGSTYNLNVHHKVYTNKGREYVTWREDLIVLCNKHHKVVHEIE